MKPTTPQGKQLATPQTSLVPAMQLRKPELIASHPLVHTQVEIPVPGPAQVRLNIQYCGICHTDLHIAEGEIHPPRLPIIPGHQVVGVIDALGEGASGTGLQIGQRVGVPWLHATDRTCKYCLQGSDNLCPQAKFTGFDVNGGYAGAMLAEAGFVIPLPAGISDVQAAPLLCAGIIGYRSLRRAELQPGEHLGLVGFGASAHLAIQIALFWGCTVSVFTRSPGHQRLALDSGAAWVGEIGQNPPTPLDRAVIFAPAGELVPQTLEKLRPGGTLAINAVYMSDIPAFPYPLIYGERSLRSVANATYQDGLDFFDLAARIGIRANLQIYDLKDANQALQDLKNSQINGEAVLQIA